MPVNYDNFFRTVRFSYTNERHGDFVLDFEFHYTDEFGPTLTIHNMESGPLSLPFSAYADAVDAIRAEGAAGAPVVPRPAAPPSPRGVAAPNRLMPTRVANAQPQQMRPTRPNVVAPKQPHVFEPMDQMPDSDSMGPAFGGINPYAGGVYAEQQTILTSDGVVESLHNTQPPARKQPRQQQAPAKPPRQVPPPEEMDDEYDGPDEEESLPPEMSLRNGMAKRKGVEQGQGIKRIKKLDPIPDHGQR